MIDIFDTYTKRANFSKMVDWFSGWFVVSIIGLGFFHYNNSPLFLFFILGFFIGLLFLVINFNLGRFSDDHLYIKDGELVLTETTLTLNSKVFDWIDLRSVEITAVSYKGKRSKGISNGIGNKIYVTTKSGEFIQLKFAIKSAKQFSSLGAIMKEWRKNGFKIISNGIDLI